MQPQLEMGQREPRSSGALDIAGLFAGIGGIELGLERAGHQSKLLCEIDPGAGRILETRFPNVALTRDVREITALARVDLLAGGFPCQDLSQAGRTAGIRGRNSGLVAHVFRLLDARKRAPRWLMLENVSFMLHLDRGRAMRHLIHELEGRGFSWAYRVVDTRAFGLPQRRHRVILLASRSDDPRPVLLNEDAGEDVVAASKNAWCGFYWTEGIRGLGWAEDAVPTLKGGSTIGIASPPAIWNPRSGLIGTPDIRDAERLQGFDADWTKPALEVQGVRRGHRWKLVGNAVSVPVAEWVGHRLTMSERFLDRGSVALPEDARWPRAAWGYAGKVHTVDVSMWPVRRPRATLSEFLQYPLTPLSERAASGFLSRTARSTLTFPPGFLDAVASHVARMRQIAAA
jgi:DNA (cytosine-5)-methyltransferase 1